MKILPFLAAAAALALASCAELAGTSLAFDTDGNVTISAVRPIIISSK